MRRAFARENTWDIRYRTLKEAIERVPAGSPSLSPRERAGVRGEQSPTLSPPHSSLSARVRELLRDILAL